MQPVLHVRGQMHRAEGRSLCGHMVAKNRRAMAEVEGLCGFGILPLISRLMYFYAVASGDRAWLR